MTTVQIIVALTPLLVLGATQLVVWVTGKIDGKIVIVLVPVLTLIASWVTSLVTTGVPFWGQVGFGLISTFVYEFVKQYTAKK